MPITRETTVAELVNEEPATISVFQRHGIEFCCGGHVPLGEVCLEEHLDFEVLASELRNAIAPFNDLGNWQAAPLPDLVAHIQKRYHAPLYEELPRLSALARKVHQRHGERFPEMLGALRSGVELLEQDLTDHVRREDKVLFPAIVASAADLPGSLPGFRLATTVDVMSQDHRRTAGVLAALRALTNGYQPPEDACPTFRGLYYGLAALEHRMRLHTHIEDNVLFPRAVSFETSLGDESS